MILYKKGQYGLPVQTTQGNLTALQGSDSLSTASGRETHAARGFGAPDNNFRIDVSGEKMVNGKPQLQYRAYGNTKGVTPEQRSQALAAGKAAWNNRAQLPATASAPRTDIAPARTTPVTTIASPPAQTLPVGRTGRRNLGSFSF